MYNAEIIHNIGKKFRQSHRFSIIKSHRERLVNSYFVESFFKCPRYQINLQLSNFE